MNQTTAASDTTQQGRPRHILTRVAEKTFAILVKMGQSQMETQMYTNSSLSPWSDSRMGQSLVNSKQFEINGGLK